MIIHNRKNSLSGEKNDYQTQTAILTNSFERIPFVNSKDLETTVSLGMVLMPNSIPDD